MATNRTTAPTGSTLADPGHSRTYDQAAADRREYQAHLHTLEFLRGVEVEDSGWAEWTESVAKFNRRWL